MITALGGGVDIPEEAEGFLEKGGGDGMTVNDGGALKGVAGVAL